MHTEALHHKWKIIEIDQKPAGDSAFIDLRDPAHSWVKRDCQGYYFVPKYGRGGRMQLSHLTTVAGNCLSVNSLYPLLAGISRFSLSQEELVLSNSAGNQLLRAVKAPDDENGSLQRNWQILEMINGDSEQLKKDQAFLDLRQADGSVAHLGCNQFRLQIHQQPPYLLRITGGAATRKFCAAAARNEEVFGKMLPLVAKYQIVGNILRLFDRQDQLLLRARSAL
ncbi:hypothetical protein GCM10027051_13020 [Niabella terrae]